MTTTNFLHFDPNGPQQTVRFDQISKQQWFGLKS